MNEAKLNEIQEKIKDKSIDREQVMVLMGEYMIEDIAGWAHEHSETLPEVQDILNQYKELPHFEAIMGLVDITIKQLEYFCNVLLREGDLDDFKAPAELEA